MSDSLKSLFDIMLANYEPETLETANTSHSYCLMGHLILSNIFLLNYLIAILSTVYDLMREGGDYAYKANRYEYIDKYQQALESKYGYDELVVTPTPLNALTAILAVVVGKKNTMKRAAEIYSKYVMFWLIENSFFIFFFFLYELFLVPVIYIKMMYHIGKSQNFKSFIWIFPLWICFGYFILIAFCIGDTVQFVKSLCDSGDLDDDEREKK